MREWIEQLERVRRDIDTAISTLRALEGTIPEVLVRTSKRARDQQTKDKISDGVRKYWESKRTSVDSTANASETGPLRTVSDHLSETKP